MADDFFVRLRGYYEQVASVLRGEAAVASIFPNSTDIGMSREKSMLNFCASMRLRNVTFSLAVFYSQRLANNQNNLTSS